MSSSSSKPKKLVNLTPHTVKVLKYSLDNFGDVNDPDDFIEYPSQGEVRVLSNENQKLEVDESSTFGVYSIIGRPIYFGIEGLPEDKNTPIIVSIIVAQFLFDLLTDTDWPGGVYVPDTSPEGVIRDSQGRIFGVKRLIKYEAEE